MTQKSPACAGGHLQNQQQVEPARYLILSDPAEVAAAQKLVGERYLAISLHDAQNGSRNALDGHPVLCWPDATTQGQQRMQDFAMSLVGDCPEIKYLDTSLPLGSTMRPAVWLEFDVFRAWALGEADQYNRVQIITDQPEAPAPELPAGQAQPDNGSSLPVPSAQQPALDASDPYDEDQAAERALDSIVPRGTPASAPESTVGYERSPGPGELYVAPSDDPSGIWPEPLDLSQSLYHGLPLPLDACPDALQPIIADCAARTGVDSGAWLLGFLCAASGLAPDHLLLQPKQNDTDWTVRPCIWGFAIGNSSSGKSVALEYAMGFIKDMDSEAVTENTRKLKDWAHAMKGYEQDCATAVKNKAPRPVEPEPPTLREYWMQRGTTEGLTRLLEHSSKVTWYIDEGSALINSWDRYTAKGSGAGDREFVLMLWNGGRGKNTLAGKTVMLANASAVICGGSTPQSMSAAAGKLQKDGFLQRNLIAMVPRKQRGLDQRPSAEARATYEAILRNLVEMPPAMVTLDNQAAQVYAEFQDSLETRSQTVAEDEALLATLDKWPGIAARLMLLYFAIDQAAQGRYVTGKIPEHIAQQVCSLLLDWQFTHQLAFWRETMGTTQAAKEFAQTMSRFILANPQLTVLEFRDHIARPHNLKLTALKPWELKEAINLLIDAAWITPMPGKVNTRGMPARYAVNPKLSGMFERQREQECEKRALSREALQRMRSDHAD